MADVVGTRSPVGTDQPAPAAGNGVREAASAPVREVAETATTQGMQVMESVQEQGAEVAAEAGRQVRNLAGEAGTQLTAQARAQQERAAGGLRAIGEELREMSEASSESGTATELVRQASTRITDLAGWLEDRDPGAVLDEVRTYARRNPGTFLLGAAALGVLAGRVTRNLGGSTGTSGGHAATGAPVHGTAHDTSAYGTPAYGNPGHGAPAYGAPAATGTASAPTTPMPTTPAGGMTPPAPTGAFATGTAPVNTDYAGGAHHDDVAAHRPFDPATGVGR